MPRQTRTRSLPAFEPVSVREREFAGKRFGESRDWGGIFGVTGRFPEAETALSRVSRGKAAESQRLFRPRQETGFVQDCVVGLVGLELADKRL